MRTMRMNSQSSNRTEGSSCSISSSRRRRRRRRASFRVQFAVCQALLISSTVISTTSANRTNESSALQSSLFLDEELPRKHPPFGSVSGYDVGGPDPLCFVSQLVNASSDGNDGDNNAEAAFEEDEADELFWNQSQVEARLVPTCPLNTSLTVRETSASVDPQWEDTLFTGTPYEFELNFGLTIPSTSPLLADFQNNSRLHFRIVMCNALLRGFCSPVMDFQYQKVIWEEEDNHLVQQQGNQQLEGDSQSKQQQQQPHLIGVANTDQRAIASPFVRFDNRGFELDDHDDATHDHGHYHREASLNVQFEIPHNVQVGTYLFIAHAKLLVKDNATDTLQRLDVAASLPQFSVQVEHPPNIQRVSRGTKIGLGISSGLVGLASLLALIFIIYHRNHDVMRLAQAPFLMALLICVLIGSTFVFTYMPEKNVYCTLRGLLVDVPYATSAAILLARCWRVHVTLCNANTLGRSASPSSSSLRERFSFGQNTVLALTWLAKFPFRIGQCCAFVRNPWNMSIAATSFSSTSATTTRSSRRDSFRQTATAMETASLCIILAMPELILQVLGITLAGPRLELQYDKKAEIGRSTCQSEIGWVQKAGLAWMAVLLLLAVTVAWSGRDLPTAFNEKTAIFNTASVCAVILLVSLVFNGITDDAQTAPFVPLFLGCLNIFGLSIAILVNIIMPKIARVLSGEKVVITHLLARYNQQATGGAFVEDPSAENYQSILQKRSSTVGGQIPAIYSPGEIMKLKRDDPLPRKLESGIYEVQGLLGQISRLCGEGRTPSTSDWNRMRRNVAQLKMELDLVELSWSSEEDDDDDEAINDDTGPVHDDEEEPSMPLSCGSTTDHTCMSPDTTEHGKGP